MHKPNVGSQFQAFGLVQHHCILQSSMHGQHDHSCNFRSESALARPKLWQGLICQKAAGVGVYETPNALRGEVKPRIIRLRGLGKRRKHQVTVRTPKFCSRWNEDDKKPPCHTAVPFAQGPANMGSWARAPWPLPHAGSASDSKYSVQGQCSKYYPNRYLSSPISRADASSMTDQARYGITNTDTAD